MPPLSLIYTSKPESPLSQYLRTSKESSPIFVETHLPICEDPRQALSTAKWGVLKGLEIAETVNTAYAQIVKWRRNLFQVPTRIVGQLFIEEMTKTVSLFTSSSALEEVALTMVMVMPPLLLQKPSRKSKTKEDVTYLEKRLQRTGGTGKTVKSTYWIST